MLITILGGGGFLGRKLAQRLAKDGALDGTAITGLTLFDLQAPPLLPAPFPVRCLGGNIADPTDVAAAVPPGTAVVVHLAAVVSAQAEADFDLGLTVNVQGTLAVLQACRALPAAPRVVFTSSVASFGGGQDARLEDDARQIPGNSYGAEKAIGELLLQDASRRGFLDAVNIRLPTVIIRPGRPNKAASSFVSAILREPLLGLPTDLPVADDFAVWICSPRRAIASTCAALALLAGRSAYGAPVADPAPPRPPFPPPLAPARAPAAPYEPRAGMNRSSSAHGSKSSSLSSRYGLLGMRRKM